MNECISQVVKAVRASNKRTISTSTTPKQLDRQQGPVRHPSTSSSGTSPLLRQLCLHAVCRRWPHDLDSPVFTTGIPSLFHESSPSFQAEEIRSPAWQHQLELSAASLSSWTTSAVQSPNPAASSKMAKDKCLPNAAWLGTVPNLW